MMKIRHGLLIAVVVLAVWPAGSTAERLVGRATAACDDHPNQASAQRAKDTRDSDGDGIYCESLPCPCLPPDPRADPGGGSEPQGDRPPEQDASCVKPRGVQRLVFSASKYPNIRAHVRAAISRGWPRRMVVNRPGADARRDRLMDDIPTREGFDRDEYPAAVGRGKGKGLERGRNPRGWRADVEYVPSSENRSHGATLGNKLADFCNGTRFRYVFR